MAFWTTATAAWRVAEGSAAGAITGDIGGCLSGCGGARGGEPQVEQVVEQVMERVAGVNSGASVTIVKGTPSKAPISTYIDVIHSRRNSRTQFALQEFAGTLVP